MIYRILILITVVLSSCSQPEETPAANIYEIRDVGELSTTEYTIGKIVKLDDSEYGWTKWGERKILIKTRAKVKAGIDLSKIKKEDIKVKGNTVEIKLPPAKITTFTMDPQYTYTEMESITGLRDGFTQQEKNKFLKQGEKAIRKDLEETDILNDAERNAQTFIEDFYKQLGYKKVIINQTSDK